MKALLIPVKDPSKAKTRLAELLTEDERRRLAWTMLEDVARAVESSTRPDRVILVSSFEPAVDMARDLDWEVLIEENQISESDSVDWASRILSERRFDMVMRLPADLPLVKGQDIDDLMSITLESPGAILVPSSEGSGTNAIIRTPPTLFPSRFGPNSLALHKREAALVGVECRIVNNPRIALDIDEASDIERLLAEGAGTRSFTAISDMGVIERLRNISRFGVRED